jgi:hypothetical protein
LYWCLDLIRHNIGTQLKLNKYIFDISIPFCHHLYLSATLKQCFTDDISINFMGRTKTVFEAKKGAEILLSLWQQIQCPPFFF